MGGIVLATDGSRPHSIGERYPSVALDATAKLIKVLAKKESRVDFTAWLKQPRGFR